MVQVVCVCGRKFDTTDRRISNGRGRFCSRACAYANRTRPSGLTYNLARENPTSFQLGQEPWNKGLRGTHFSPDTEFKPGEHRSPGTEFKPGQMEKISNPRWVGSKIRYDGLHSRLLRERGRAREYACAHADDSCRGPMHWANISHYYKDVQDFMPLCQSHHIRYDRRARMIATRWFRS